MASYDQLKSSYSRHHLADARIAGAIGTHSDETPLTQGRIVERIDVAQATVSRILQRFIGDSLLEVGGLVEIHNRGPIPHELLPTTKFDEAVEANPDWQRAARIQGLMDRMGMDEGAVLDSALSLLEQTLMDQHSGS